MGLNSPYFFSLCLTSANPPYQLNVGVEKENYAMPIYQKFVSQAKKLKPRFISMIIPARWYAGGRGLDEFRKEMLEDTSLRVIHDFPDAADCFPGVQIKAGVCYFLWERDNKGDCAITTHLNNEVIGPVSRPLLEQGSDTFIRYNQAISIVHKVYHPGQRSFSELVSPQTPFGVITSYKGTPERQSRTDVKMYISGNEKQFKGGTAFCPAYKITKGHEMIPWHKIYIGKAGSGSDSFPHSILSEPFYGEPNTICNQTYLVIGPFKDIRNREQEIAQWFIDFEAMRAADELKAPEDQDPKLVIYHERVSNSSDAMDSLTYRHNFLKESLLSTVKNLPQKDPKRNFDEAQRQVIFRRDKGICKVCGRQCEWNDWEADHIIPWSKGGKTEVENGQVLCPSCNSKKSDN